MPTDFNTKPETACWATAFARFQYSASGARSREPSQVKLNWQPVTCCEP